MDNIKKELKERFNVITVNDNKEDIDNVNSNTLEGKINKLLEEHNTKPEGVGIKLSEDLSDSKSVEYFTILVKANIEKLHILFEALAITKDADRRGVIRKTKAVYFIGILRKLGLKTKFKKDEK